MDEHVWCLVLHLLRESQGPRWSWTRQGGDVDEDKMAKEDENDLMSIVGLALPPF